MVTLSSGNMGRTAAAGMIIANAGLASAFMPGPALPMARGANARVGAAAARRPLNMVAIPPIQAPGSPGSGDDSSLWKGTENLERELVRVPRLTS